MTDKEIDRLRVENIALTSKVRELEQTLASAYRVGVRLRKVLAKYERGQEPTPQELADLGTDPDDD